MKKKVFAGTLFLLLLFFSIQVEGLDIEIQGTFTPTVVITGDISVTVNYPTNQSSNVPLQPSVSINVSHANGSSMDISLYYGLTEGNETILFGTYSNMNNCTILQLLENATSRSTNYYWRVNINDGSNQSNFTFSFKTEGLSGAGATSYPYPSYGVGLLGVLGIFGLISFLFVKKKIRNRIKEE